MLGKKVILLILTGAMMASSFTMVFAQTDSAVEEKVITQVQGAAASSTKENPNISKEKAIEIVNKIIMDYFGADVKDKKFQSNIEYREDYEIRTLNVWQVNYYYNDMNKNMSYNVTVNADNGKIITINMYVNENNVTDSSVSTITYEQAKNIAVDFIKKINPDKADQVELIDNNSAYYSPYNRKPAIYNFRFLNKINGIRFDRNSIDIAVNGVSGKLQSYTYRWIDDYEFPSIEGIVEKEKAMEIFMNESKITLRYITERNDDVYNQNPEKAKLVYGPNFENGSLLDAKNGKLTDYGVNYDEINTIDLSKEEKDEILRNLKPADKQDKELDRAKATEIINGYLKDLVGSDYEADQIAYSEYNNSWNGHNKVWNAQFRKKEATGQSYENGGNITIDAFTGEIINLYSYNMFKMEQQVKAEDIKLTWEDAYKKSVDIISKIYPDKFKDVKTMQRYIKNAHIVNNKEIGELSYNFSFPRVVNGIDYPENSIYVSIDTMNGSVISLNNNWFENIEFSTTDGIIKPEDAKKLFIESHEPRLIYILPYNFSKDENVKQEIKLVYSLNAKLAKEWAKIASIDASTGKLIDYDGRELKHETNTAADKFKDHWAEKELTILGYQGIIDLTSFEAEKEITLVDAIKIIVNAKGYYPYNIKDTEKLNFTNIKNDDPDAKYILLAIKYGVIENTETEFDKSGAITREKMAELMVKLLQYEKLSEADDIFSLSFEDAASIDQNYYGCVAICKGLGILQGSNNLFRPKDTATMAEFAITVFKTLENMKNEIRYY